MYDEMMPLVKRAEYESRIGHMNEQGWELPPPTPSRVRLALARTLVALAVRLAPTITLPTPHSHRAASNLA